MAAQNTSSQDSLIPTPTADHTPANAHPFPNSYSFDAPDALMKLDKSLKEISGLTLLDEQRLAAVQDEKGKLYIINARNGEISTDRRFAKDGDFEGIELAGDLLYALRSDGDLYEISDWDTKDPDTEKFETHLGSKNDTEGLTYDAMNNRLLIVCKEQPGAGLKNARAVYSFDLSTKKMSKDPVLVIDLKAVEALTEKNKLNSIVRNLAAPLTNLSGFKPAGLAIHPITGQLFIISSVRKVILAYNMDGTLEDVWLLPEDDFRQPEGLAFLPNGDLFIANEGGNGAATLMRFNYK
ncbi:MAG: SdiA-regulated domain-containing protein [Bacteroidota bacterium]